LSFFDKKTLARRSRGFPISWPPRARVCNSKAFRSWSGTTLLIIAVAFVACWLPARRAARINPIEARRAE
jgi:hypothetical protein